MFSVVFRILKRKSNFQIWTIVLTWYKGDCCSQFSKLAVSAVMNIFPIVPILGHLLLSYPNTNIAQMLAKNMNHVESIGIGIHYTIYIFTSSYFSSIKYTLISIHNSEFTEFVSFGEKKCLYITYTPDIRKVG